MKTDSYSLTYLHNRRGWQKCLEDHCAELKGHRVVWRKDADPYWMKLLKSAQRQRLPVDLERLTFEGKWLKMD